MAGVVIAGWLVWVAAGLWFLWHFVTEGTFRILPSSAIVIECHWSAGKGKPIPSINSIIDLLAFSSYGIASFLDACPNLAIDGI